MTPNTIVVGYILQNLSEDICRAIRKRGFTLSDILGFDNHYDALAAEEGRQDTAQAWRGAVAKQALLRNGISLDILTSFDENNF